MAASSTTRSTLAKAPKAGKSKAFWRIIRWAVYLIAVVGISAAEAEPVRGRSRDLGVDFEAVGGADWCKQSVVVRLTAPSASAYQPGNDVFTVMLGRIRAIIRDQCSSAEFITIEGEVNHNRVFAVEVSRLTKWESFILLDPETLRPSCDDASSNPLECNKRIAAYATANQLMRGQSFADTELTIILDIRSDDHLVWRTNTVLGKLQVISREELGGRYAESAAFSDAAVAQIRDGCTIKGGRLGQSSSNNYAGDMAYRSVICQPTGRVTVQNVVLVASENNWFYVFSLSSDEPNIAAATEFGVRLVKAITAQ